MNRKFNVSGVETIGGASASAGSNTAISLNTDYIHGTAGDSAVAIRYMAQTADPIDALYIFLDDIGGTRANISMQCDIYNEHATTVTRAGTTLRDSSTACTIPSGNDMWIKFTFGTPYTPAVGEILWLVCYNTSAAPTTDYPIIRHTCAHSAHRVRAEAQQAVAMFARSTDGFVTSNGSSGPFLITQGSNHIAYAFTNTSSTYYTNNTLERGIQFTPTEDVVVWACGVYNPNTSWAAFRILADATAPGGTALNEYDLDSDANETTNDIIGAKVFDSPVTLVGGTTYKATLTASANLQRPTVNVIEDYSSYSAVFDAWRAQDKMMYPWGVIDNGAGGWTTDKSIAPEVALYIDDYPAIAGGGAYIIGG